MSKAIDLSELERQVSNLHERALAFLHRKGRPGDLTFLADLTGEMAALYSDIETATEHLELLDDSLTRLERRRTALLEVFGPDKASEPPRLKEWLPDFLDANGVAVQREEPTPDGLEA